MSVDVIASDPRTAHMAVQEAWRVSKELTSAGKQVHITAREEEDDRSVRQNSYYWGACLREISEQASINGQRYTADAWHELFKRQFLGYEIKKIKVAGRKKATIIRRLRSTAGLKVKAFAAYLEKVQAFAVTDLGVQFSEVAP